MQSTNVEPFHSSMTAEPVVGAATLGAYARGTATAEADAAIGVGAWSLKDNNRPEENRRTVEQAAARLRAHGWQAIPVPTLQRLVEGLLAAIMLVLTAPILAVICLIVRLDSPGPVLFRQWRVGKGGRYFRFTKVRTLYADARERWPELYAYSYTPEQLDGLRFKVPDDPRVTRVGSWLRKSTLDELPNLWHVLNGDMALVGPRPEIPEMLPYYTDDTIRKFSVRPGVTGLAQVSGRGNLTFHDTVAYDVQYVDARGYFTDARILFLTLVRSLQRRGAF